MKTTMVGIITSIWVQDDLWLGFVEWADGQVSIEKFEHMPRIHNTICC